jgi:uncharacterized membrane protein YphA (DoxX/SURF4 family)
MNPDRGGDWRASGLRLAFALVWSADAALKWQPAFFAHVDRYFARAAVGQPGWLQPWFGFWTAAVHRHAGVVAWSTAIAESLLALSLWLGVGRRLAYLGGALLSAGIWMTAEGFGGPYAPGATDIGSGLLYALVFAALALVGDVDRWTLDRRLCRRWRWWRRLGGFAAIRPPVSRAASRRPPTPRTGT